MGIGREKRVYFGEQQATLNEIKNLWIYQLKKDNKIQMFHVLLFSMRPKMQIKHS